MTVRVLYILLLLSCFACKSPEARPPVSVDSGSFLKESAERNKKLNAREKEQIEAVIKNYSDKDFIISNSGFWYTYETKVESTNGTPQFGDTVNFDFDITNLSNKSIYPKANKSYIMDKEELFTGLREGLKLMKVNETITFIFPSQKAFGYYGDDNKIGTNVPIICKVTLNSITKNDD